MHNLYTIYSNMSEANLLKEYIKEILRKENTFKKLRVFDFDDTLVKTDSLIYVTSSKGKKFALTPGAYAVYKPKRGDVFDYSDFEKLINPREIKWVGHILRKVYQKHGPSGSVILTARGHEDPVRQFLNDINLPGIEIIALNDANPAAKVSWIENRIISQGLTLVEFFDDSYKNAAAASELIKKYPDVLIKVRHVVHHTI